MSGEGLQPPVDKEEDDNNPQQGQQAEVEPGPGGKPELDKGNKPAVEKLIGFLKNSNQ